MEELTNRPRLAAIIVIIALAIAAFAAYPPAIASAEAAGEPDASIRVVSLAGPDHPLEAEHNPRSCAAGNRWDRAFDPHSKASTECPPLHQIEPPWSAAAEVTAPVTDLDCCEDVVATVSQPKTEENRDVEWPGNGSPTPEGEDSNATLPAEPVTQPAVDTVEPVIEPVVDTIEPVNEPMVDTVEPVTETVSDAVEPVTEPVADTVEPVTEPVVDTIEPVVEPVVDTIEPVTEPVVDAAEPVAIPGIIDGSESPSGGSSNGTEAGNTPPIPQQPGASGTASTSAGSATARRSAAGEDGPGPARARALRAGDVAAATVNSGPPDLGSDPRSPAPASGEELFTPSALRDSVLAIIGSLAALLAAWFWLRRQQRHEALLAPVSGHPWSEEPEFHPGGAYRNPRTWRLRRERHEEAHRNGRHQGKRVPLCPLCFEDPTGPRDQERPVRENETPTCAAIATAARESPGARSIVNRFETNGHSNGAAGSAVLGETVLGATLRGGGDTHSRARLRRRNATPAPGPRQRRHPGEERGRKHSRRSQKTAFLAARSDPGRRPIGRCHERGGAQLSARYPRRGPAGARQG